MNENSMLSLLAQLCGNITTTSTTDPAALARVKEALADSIISNPASAV
jgi:hypothetical protein